MTDFTAPNAYSSRKLERMDTSKPITLSLNGVFNGEPISPSNISARVLLKFVEAAAKFVAGKRGEWRDQSIEIAEGSFEVAQEPLDGDESIWSDFTALQNGNDSAVTESRRVALTLLRDIVQIVPSGHILIRHHTKLILQIEAPQSKVSLDDDWYPVERWMFVRIEHAGGAQPKIWLHLQDKSKVRIATSADLLQQEQANFLYHERLLHIRAEENFNTGELRGHRLVAFTPYKPDVNAEAMAAFVAEGTKAWAGVVDADAWLAELRGH